MSSSSGLIDLERFRTVVAQRLGLHFDDAKLGFLGEVLQRRIDKLQRPGDSYLRSLEHESAREKLAALAEELTVTETYFFRNNEQYRALAEIVLPQLVRLPRSPL